MKYYGCVICNCIVWYESDNFWIKRYQQRNEPDCCGKPMKELEMEKD